MVLRAAYCGMLLFCSVLIASSQGKVIRWFVDGRDGFTSEKDQQFMLKTHSDIVNSVHICCGQAGIFPNGSFRYNIDADVVPVLKTFNSLQKAVTLSVNGGPPAGLPVSAFLRRNDLAEEILTVLEKFDLNGITIDIEGTYVEGNGTVGPASVAQFAATWHSVAKLLHTHGKTIGICINTGIQGSQAPNMTSAIDYGADWAFSNYIPFMDYLVDMSTYPLPHVQNVWGSNITISKCDPNNHYLGHWCHLEGLVQNQIDSGVSPENGQLSPGVWVDECSKDGKQTTKGWTQDSLHDFLGFLTKSGVISIDIWTSNATSPGANNGCPMPCPYAPTCSWVYTELRSWIAA
eukprot:m.272472 g.272472  ORF g.272472 m.272472 type:complete len:347 (-) comp16271_c1_seq2:303-1343(-)